MCRWPRSEEPWILDLNKRLCVIGFSLRLALSLFHPQAGFACTFAFDCKGKFLPLLGFGYLTSGTKRRIVVYASVLFYLREILGSYLGPETGNPHRKSSCLFRATPS